MSLAGKVCLVTGGTRGIGKGVALQLGEAGATVYVTGRTLSPKSTSVGGSLTDTEREIVERGGRCIPVQCDHSKDEDVEKLFDKINKEQSGQLDILVNNAYAAFKPEESIEKATFWEKPLSAWDDVNIVGLRNHYLCTVYAARMMVPRKSGLIVNISSIGGIRYLGNVPYGIGKEGLDRMAADCGHELRNHNVACLSLWPGVVKTENMLHLLSILESRKTNKLGDMEIDTFRGLVGDGETAEFTGKAVLHLALDKNIMSKTGKVAIVADLANEYGFKDIDGKKKPSMRQLNFILSLSNMVWLARFIPNFIKIPCWMMTLTGNKF